ncbi:N-acyl amino acid synthase FeeM domain-containing protein [Massilia sp. DWR3-1-1]|uniref:N-acyl amino acid synthase FeeM domain-containing protein n=1 Tax=Massilia sp. DWR3-1-1 TaxID=2804559 RepID=UPI003CF993E8
MMLDDTSLASFSVSPRATVPAAPAVPVSDVKRALHDGTRQVRRQDGAAEQVFHIRLADSSSHQQAAHLLIRKMYGWRGYAVEADGGGPSGRLTLFAECHGVVVGTLGLCLDGAVGLPADENFREQLDILRDQGLRLCEPSRLAIDAGMTKRVFASMIHVSYLYAHVLHGYSDYIIEVNPRHVAFYQRMLGFERVGPVRPCSRVGAPAVLLRLPLSVMATQISACGGRPELQSDERSFYPFFFAPAEEAGIIARLLAARRQE